jgi:hypothetical protein
VAVAVRNKATKLYSALVNYLIFIVLLSSFFGFFFNGIFLGNFIVVVVSISGTAEVVVAKVVVAVIKL